MASTGDVAAGGYTERTSTSPAGSANGDTTPVTFVVVDDDPAIRHLVTVQARLTPEIRLIGRADDGGTGIGVVATLQPRVVLLDLMMPTPGVDVMPALRQVAPHSSIIAWSASQDALAEAREAGVDGGIEKMTAWPEVARRIVQTATDAAERDDDTSPVRTAAALRYADLRLLAAEPFLAPVAEDATWPCPGCRDRRPLVGAWNLQVSNRNGDPLERRVLVCAVCAEAFGVTPMRTPG